MTSLERKTPAKKWGKIYTERVDHLIKQRDKKLQAFANERRSSMDSAATGECDSLPKLSLAAFMRNCKHTVDNVVPPPRQLDWNIHWGTQLLCYICSTPAYSDCIVCSKCNLIAHQLCSESLHIKSNVQRPKLWVMKSRVSPSTQHTCPECKEAFQNDVDFYQKIVDSLRDEKIRLHCANVITKRAKIFIEKKRAIRKKISVILIQSLFRGKLVRVKYLTDLRSKPRIVILKFKQLPRFAPGVQSVTIVTVVDTFKDVQLFRYDKTTEQSLCESIMIPGITWYMTIVVTIAAREDGNSFYIVGQTQLCMRDLDDMMKHKELVLQFFEKVSVSHIR